jgi:hypothetical protein
MDAGQDGPLDARESWKVARQARADAQRALRTDEWPIVTAWGTAWAVAFGWTGLVAEGDPPVLGLPEWTIGLAWLLAIGGAVLFTGVYLARHSRGVGGRSEEVHRLTGWAWILSFAFAFSLVGLLDLRGPESGVVFVFTVAALYLVQAANERDRLFFGAGVWIGAVNVAAYGLMPTRYSLIMALLGAGGLLVSAVLLRRRERSPEQPERTVAPMVSHGR